MSDDIYLMVNDTKIDIPEELFNKILKIKSDNNSRRLEIEEFYLIVRRFFPIFEKEWIRIIHRVENDHDNGYYLTVKFPNCNTSWSYAIFDACKEFCGEDEGFDYYDPFSDLSSTCTQPCRNHQNI